MTIIHIILHAKYSFSQAKMACIDHPDYSSKMIVDTHLGPVFGKGCSNLRTLIYQVDHSHSPHMAMTDLLSAAFKYPIHTLKIIPGKEKEKSKPAEYSVLQPL